MKIGNALRSEKSELLYKESDLLVSNTTALGMEFEIENFRYHQLNASPRPVEVSRVLSGEPITVTGLKSFWNVVKDGSLRDGIEFIFSSPLEGANIIAALTKLDALFKEYRHPQNMRPIKLTDRCSVHVHMDVRDMDDKELNNLIIMYILHERLFFTLVDSYRIKNNYCKPLVESDFKYVFSRLLQDSGSDDNVLRLIQAVSNQCDKYSALNILPIASQGSVEFRMHQGCGEPLKMIPYLNCILNLKELSLKYSASDVVAMYKGKGYKETLEDLWKGTPFSEFSDEYTVTKGINDALEVMNIADLERSKVQPGKKTTKTLLYQYKLANKLIQSK